MNTFRRAVSAAAVVVLAAGALAVPAAGSIAAPAAGVASDSTVYQICVKKKSGKARLVPQGTSCARSEVRLRYRVSGR